MTSCSVASQRGDRVGQQRLRVAQAFELDPVGAGVVEVVEQLAGQPGVADGVLGAEAAGRVGQDRVALQVEVIEDVAALLVDQPLAADGDGGHLAAAGRQAVAHQLELAYLPVPVKSRLRNDELADRQRLVVGAAGRPAADQGDDLERVARRERCLGVPGPGHQVLVDLDGDVFRLEPEVPQQFGDGQRPGHLAPLAVDGDLHDRFHRSPPA